MLDYRSVNSKKTHLPKLREKIDSWRSKYRWFCLFWDAKLWFFGVSNHDSLGWKAFSNLRAKIILRQRFAQIVHSYCWWFRNPANQLRLIVHPIICKVLAPSQLVSRISSFNSMKGFYVDPRDPLRSSLPSQLVPASTWRIIPGLVTS